MPDLLIAKPTLFKAHVCKICGASPEVGVSPCKLTDVKIYCPKCGASGANGSADKAVESWNMLMEPT